MAVFRVEKNRDYTIMANHHLRNKSLSLKAKGLLSLMLSLPDDWDYTTKGLASICKDGLDSICATIKELESAGYIIRRRIRNEKGQMTKVEYTILEQPKPEKPERENPILDKPALDKPKPENPRQSNTKLLSPKESKTNKLNTQSINQTDLWIERENIKNQIDYDNIVDPLNENQVNELVEIILEVYLTGSEEIKIGRSTYPTTYVIDRFRSLNKDHICEIINALNSLQEPVKNIKQYLLVSLFNVTVTIDNYYKAKVAAMYSEVS